ncbi:hypothetical protein [Endozoicomonas acroporae]|uniref:hypothetical protein n=1 Tax=Endozoicomonas acroporae TaxID=1701104 RepID=UPI0019D62E9D|nr:hypothetical protein [Endozoicomonas acroporae]
MGEPGWKILVVPRQTGPEANCPTESTDAPSTRLTTTTTTDDSVQTTSDVLSSPLETWGNSTVTLTTTDSTDYPNYSPSAKTSLSTSLSSSPDSSSVNTADNGNTSSLLNTDEVDAGIPLPTLAGGAAAGILTGGIILYASYQWYHQQGLRGTKLALRPITCISDAICCHSPAMGKKTDSMELVSLRSIDV